LRRLKRNGASSPAVILVCPARICRGCFIARELRIEINCFSRTGPSGAYEMQKQK
jgi:hypothetical protein